MSDTELTVHTHDWPVTGRPVDPEAAARVLAEFDQHHPAAVAQLVQVEVPREDRP